MQNATSFTHIFIITRPQGNREKLYMQIYFVMLKYYFACYVKTTVFKTSRPRQLPKKREVPISLMGGVVLSVHNQCSPAGQLISSRVTIE